MRDIKFRGKTIGNEWVTGMLSRSQGIGIQPELGLYISNKVGMPWAYRVRLETIGEYTGLRDKKGAMIFEGDIIINEQWTPSTYCVKWDEQFAAFQGATLQKSPEGKPFLSSDFDAIYFEDFEIIGNIYDNPELMKGGAK